MIPSTPFAPILALLHEAWEQISRPFATCRGNCHGVGIIRYGTDGAGDFFTMVVKPQNASRHELIYVYFCPACGRKLKR